MYLNSQNLYCFIKFLGLLSFPKIHKLVSDLMEHTIFALIAPRRSIFWWAMWVYFGEKPSILHCFQVSICQKKFQDIDQL